MKTGKAALIGAIVGGGGGFLLGFTVHDATAPFLAMPISFAMGGILLGAFGVWVSRKASRAVRIGSIVGGVGGLVLGFTEHDPMGVFVLDAMGGVLVGVCVVGAVRIAHGMLGVLLDWDAQAQLQSKKSNASLQLSGGVHSIEFRSVLKVASSTRYEHLGTMASKSITTTTYNIGDSMHHVASWKRTVLHPARLGLAGLAIFSLVLAFPPGLPSFAILGGVSLMAAVFFSAPHYEMVLRALTDRGDRSPGFMSWVDYCLNRPFRMIPDDKWDAFIASLERSRRAR
jgi:hypothetical protein